MGRIEPDRRTLPLVEEWLPPAEGVERFDRIAGEPFALLLDSALRMPGIGRHSFLAAFPFLTLVSRGAAVVLRRENGREEAVEGDPFEVLSGLLSAHALPARAGLPPFQGGAAGYFAYDLGRRIERLPSAARDDLGLPELAIGFYDAVAAFDHEAGRGWLVSTGLPERGEAAVRRARERLERLRRALEAPAPAPGSHRIRGELRSAFDREGYEAAVERCRRYIVEGDLFQVNLSQRFQAGFEGDAFALHRTLRRVNPAPFAAFFRAPGVDVVSASPERFLRAEGDRVQTRPIKGTRRRGADVAEDRRLAEELLGSAKDRAENTMIVDLLRNDLGRVCRPGTIRVAELCALETFPTVFHLTSTVEGTLAEGRGCIDLLRASFPGGSITGAPKVRAMEIIEELEPTRRCVYTGAIGYLGFSGSMDLNIAIRTILCAGGNAYYQVGGGIVYDSDPGAEYDETMHKGRALALALTATEPPRTQRTQRGAKVVP